MKKQTNIKLILIFLMSFWIVFMIIYINNFYLDIISTLNRVFHLNSSNNATDSYCETNGEWLSISNLTYFRKSAAYYFTDLKIIYLNFLRFLHVKSTRFSFNLNVHVKSNLRTHVFTKQINAYNHFLGENWATSYQQQTISIDFDLEDELMKDADFDIDLEKTEDIKMNLEIFDEILKLGLRMPLNLKVKNSPHYKPIYSNSSSTAVCSKVLFIDTERQFDNFKMWVHINQHLGYEKLVVYNRPGYLFDKKRQNYFYRHKNLIEVRQQICVPNLYNSTNNNLYFYDLNDVNKIIKTIYDGLDTTSYIYLAECYLDLFDQFK